VRGKVEIRPAILNQVPMIPFSGITQYENNIVHAAAMTCPTYTEFFDYYTLMSTREKETYKQAQKRSSKLWKFVKTVRDEINDENQEIERENKYLSQKQRETDIAFEKAYASYQETSTSMNTLAIIVGMVALPFILKYFYPDLNLLAQIPYP